MTLERSIGHLDRPGDTRGVASKYPTVILSPRARFSDTSWNRPLPSLTTSTPATYRPPNAGDGQAETRSYVRIWG
jgi:hypothetical protein